MARATAIGLMSGTSYDGVDVALIETDGEEIGRLGPTGYRPYSDPEREVVRRAIAVAANLTDRSARPAMLAEAEELVTDMHAEAVEAFLAANGMPPSEVAVVGFHGQTVLHRPDRGLTIQLGNGAALAGRLGIPVVYDFRAADVAAGGHGAPMVPVFHRAMLRLLKRAHPIGVLNLGGVANITFINGGAELVACDTGPGNALIDDFVRLRTGQPQDDEGRAAAAGKVDEAAVARVLKHPFFATPPPKSLDRNDFAQLKLGVTIAPADGAATLTALTVASIARIVPLLPKVPQSWVVAGGGARNLTMLRMLRERLAPATVQAADTLGWSGDAIEAQAFGFLAARGLKGLPLSYPATTGVPMPMTGGLIARP